jgi:hypothetical protein
MSLLGFVSNPNEGHPNGYHRQLIAKTRARQAFRESLKFGVHDARPAEGTVPNVFRFRAM